MGFIETGAVHRFIVRPLASMDPRSLGYLADAHALGFSRVTEVHCYDIYFIRGSLQPEQVRLLADKLLHDPVTQRVEAARLPNGAAPDEAPSAGRAGGDGCEGRSVEVALRPGVTDPTAAQIVRAAHLIGLDNINAASTGLRFVVKGQDISDDDLRTLAEKLFANAVIQQYALGEIEPSFPEEAQSSGLVELIPLRGLSDEALLAVSTDRRAALNLDEMRAVRAYCEREHRDLTDVEFEMIAQTWSEHCVHKTFKSQVDVTFSSGSQPEGKVHYDHLFNETIRAATRAVNKPWVRSAFRDNAGIIDFDGEYELSFKVETHNHPSAIEPFGGANTGIGGVIRDVIGVSAKPIASTDVLCFGPADAKLDELPAGVLHPRRIASGVVAGIQDYGNKMGIPTVNGAVWYDPGYTANPVVFCGSVGLAPVDSHPRDSRDGDHIIVLGGRTGRDGLRGATFSSMTMDAQTGAVSGASVQIGAPIVEKGLVDVLMLARDRKLYHAITDCGAGGLSSAVGEMISETGGDVQLADVPLKYPGLAPWEIWLSEAQERMVIAVPVENLTALADLCAVYEVEMSDIGRVTTSGRTRVSYGDQVVLDLENQFLHEGLPQRHYQALVKPVQAFDGAHPRPVKAPDGGYEATLLKLLAHPNIASKEKIIRVYDHEVMGATVVKPLTGVCHDGPSDAAVIKPVCGLTDTAFVLSAGLNPEYGKLDPYTMTLLAIDEAVRNAVACGADPERIAILDNFCWGDPTRPETMGDLVQSARACYDGAVRYGTPFISGKDSFNNEYLGGDGQRHAIPPTLLISAIGIMEDWRTAMTMDLKKPGDLLYLVGHFEPAFGGSHYNLACPADAVAEAVPPAGAGNPDVYKKLHAALRTGLAAACHDLSEGGLAVSAAEMALASRLGLTLTLKEGDPTRTLFGETGGCLLVEVHPELRADFETALSGLPFHQIGRVIAEPVLRVEFGGQTILKTHIEQLVKAWQGGAA